MTTDTAVLLLRMAAPLQSWGTSSRFTRRGTNLEPSKSGLVGMFAAAQGRRRTDAIADLAELRMGVRSDQPGEVLRDFQTAVRSELKADGTWVHQPRPLSERLYLSDAIFLGVVEGPKPLVQRLARALTHPVYPLALGRRSCPPAGQLVLGVEDGTVAQHLEQHEWLASEHHRKRNARRDVYLTFVRDAHPDDDARLLTREHDVPVSFDPQHRDFAWRRVVRGTVPVPGSPAPRAADNAASIFPDGDDDFMKEALCS